MEPQTAPDTIILPPTGVTAELYRAVIGPRSQEYYLKHFLRFDSEGKTSATWHWPAYWVTLNWLIYRRMWGWALAYAAALLGLVLVIFGVGKLLFSYSDTTAFILFLSLLTTAFVVPGMYANAWFYKFCNEKISVTLRGTEEVNDACASLGAQASDRKRWVAMASANVAMLALLAGVATFVFDGTPDTQKLAQASASKPVGEPLALRTQHVVTPAAEAASDSSSAITPIPPPKLEPVPPPALPVSPVPPVAVAEVVTSPVTPPNPVVSSASEPEAVPPTAPVTEPPPPVKRKAPKRRKPEVPVETTPSNSTSPVPAVVASVPAVARPRRHWLVQVGAFSQESNAQSVRMKVEAAGYQTQAEPADPASGQLIRVRVGPFDTKAEAEKALLRLRELELPTVLVRQ